MSGFTSDVGPILMQPSQINKSGQARPFDFYKLEPVVQRYHLFLVMPGALSDSLDNPDFNKLRVAVFDERLKDEIFRFELHNCGDGKLDTDKFEECDYARVPPAGNFVDPDNSRIYKDEAGDLRMCTNACFGNVVKQVLVEH